MFCYICIHLRSFDFYAYDSHMLQLVHIRKVQLVMRKATQELFALNLVKKF